MKPSTAEFIAYHLRPAKQAERRILLDFLKCANEAGIAISGSRYVGMGGTMFYDFHLMHRFLGVQNMVSLERNSKIHPRSKFNRPFDFIEVKNETAAKFMDGDKDQTKTIYWFDYDDGISPEIIADTSVLGTKVRVGGFAFITVSGHPPGVLDKANVEERLRYFEDMMGQFSLGLTTVDMENARFSMTVYKILIAALRNAFAARTDGDFHLLFQVLYKDSMPMITVGGCLCPTARTQDLANRVKADLSFLVRNPPYRIRSLNLTERERVLFDMAVTKQQTDSEEETYLRKLGFRKQEFDSYRDLIRFLPRYHESII